MAPNQDTHEISLGRVHFLNENKKEMQEKLMHTDHFTEDDETNCRVVFKVRSKGEIGRAHV